MNYIQKRLKEIEKMECDERLTDLYCLLSFVLGEDVNYEDVHDAWSIWQNRIDPAHKSLIPYNQLEYSIQILDGEYCQKIKNSVKGDE